MGMFDSICIDVRCPKCGEISEMEWIPFWFFLDTIRKGIMEVVKCPEY